MKSISPNFMFVVEITGDGVTVGFFWHRLMKGGIKYANLARLNKYLFCHFYPKEICRIMQRGKWKYILYFFFNLGSNKSCSRKFFSSMNNAMPHSSNLGRIIDHSYSYISEQLSHFF